MCQSGPRWPPHPAVHDACQQVTPVDGGLQLLHEVTVDEQAAVWQRAWHGARLQVLTHEGAVAGAAAV
jgi:hypothetical protein